MTYNSCLVPKKSFESGRRADNNPVLGCKTAQKCILSDSLDEFHQILCDIGPLNMS